ncbi:flavin oxidoreductase [Methanobrevibacter sp. 87.7]|uniref:flavin reductase family protein n=1 Tax=Methanobrevibacter sp. 87.7 TaxID=387957 RepID=UPI000B50F001|nr:flavin reductase family protein [Methanobrevibacter sp. 87.7]OWT32783.1 flavin oxidoreductase [Methanobrevibacter sp. 87.7]
MKKEANIQRMPFINTIVSCRKDGKDNALAVGFAANISFEPWMFMVGIVPERFSYDMIKDTGVFVVNIPAKGFEKEYGFIGTKSGRDVDKFKELNLNSEDGDVVDAPILTDCPVNFECTVVDSIKPGSHELFIGRVDKVHCDEEYLDDEGNVIWNKIELL